jgi:hypothetical protein
VTAGEFFLATEYTTRQDPYTAPELVLEFDAKLVTVTPDGKPIAFGFAKWENEEFGTPTGFGAEQWHQHDWKIKANEGDNA